MPAPTQLITFSSYKVPNERLHPVQENGKDKVEHPSSAIYDLQGNAQEWVGDERWLPDNGPTDRKVLEQLWQTYRIVKGVPVKPRGSEVTTKYPLAWRETVAITEPSGPPSVADLKTIQSTIGFRCAKAYSDPAPAPNKSAMGRSTPPSGG